MAEAAAHWPHYRAAYAGARTPATEHLRERAQELETLVEKFIERHGKLQQELSEKDAELERLREEVKRLKGE